MAKEKGEGAWIFVSHSHKDIEKVRFIRNEFEKRGGNPLLFFLKCLDDESELDDLIKREISERNWFILCDSPNARASKWVQEEVKMIKSLENKVFEKINLEDDIEKQLNKIKSFSRRSTVFISHTMKDGEIGRKITKKLKENDFGVYDYNEVLPSPIYSVQDLMNRAIDTVLENGIFLVLISQHTFESKYVIDEIFYAIEKNAKVFHVIVDNIEDMESLIYTHRDNQLNNKTRFVLDKLKNSRFSYKLDFGNLDKSIEELVLKLKFWDDEGEG
jgi:hypothetical protein